MWSATPPRRSSNRGLPENGAPVPPGRQPRRSRRRGPVQGVERGLRGAVGSRAALPVRPIRHRRSQARPAWPIPSAEGWAAFSTPSSAPTRPSGDSAPRPRRHGPPPGEDLEAHVDLDLSDVVFGAEREVSVRTAVHCESCDGSGAAAGTSPVRCSQCGGSGQVRKVRQSMLGQMVTAAACDRCGGLGETIEQPCGECEGHGRKLERRTYSVQVPAGVDEGTTLRLSGRGAAGPRGGPHGDLYVHTRVRPHPRFHREGSDLVARAATCPFTQAALGVRLDYETLDGTESITIARGTETGTVLQMRGRGVPHVRGRGRGDLLIHVVVDVPDDLTDEQEELVRRLARAARRGGRGGERGTVRTDPHRVPVSGLPRAAGPGGPGPHVLGSNLSGSNLSGSSVLGSNLSGSSVLGSNLSGSSVLGSNDLGPHVPGAGCGRSRAPRRRPSPPGAGAATAPRRPPHGRRRRRTVAAVPLR